MDLFVVLICCYNKSMKDTQYYKDLLVKEAEELEKQLGNLGRKNPDEKDDWQATKEEGVLDPADDGDVADSIEQYESNNAVLENLETRLHEVNNALAKIEDGTYGICNVCGEKIEDDRLEANPAAATCKTHM